MNESKSFPYRWVILAGVITAYMGSYGFALAVISPVLTPLAQAFRVSITTAALISTTMFGGAAVMSIPSGVLVDRWGIRCTAILGQVLLVAGWLITYFSASFVTILVGRAITGAGGITMAVTGAAALVQWFKPQALMLPMGIWGASLPLAAAWGTPLAGAIIERIGWRGAFLTGAIIAITCLIMAILIVKPGPLRPIINAASATRANPETSSVFKNLEVWKFNFAVLLAFIPFMTVTTYWVTWLMVSKAVNSIVTASTITGLIGMAGIFASVAAGYIAAKIRKSKPVFVIPSIAFGLCLLAFIFAQGMVPLVGLSLAIGVTTCMFAMMMFAIPPQLVPPRFTGRALGIAVISFSLGGMIGPPAIGYAFSSSGGLVWPCVLMFACLMVAAILGQTIKIR